MSIIIIFVGLYYYYYFPLRININEGQKLTELCSHIYNTYRILSAAEFVRSKLLKMYYYQTRLLRQRRHTATMTNLVTSFYSSCAE